MSYLGMVEAGLPPGFRFHPRDDELVLDYLSKKIAGGESASIFYGSMTMIDVDLNKCEPWDLPDVACVGNKEWYFFSMKDRKYATGQRTNRATESGYWKATGKDRLVYRKGVLVGMRKTLVFYRGRAPKGKKTEWVMHEFRMEGPADPLNQSFKEDWVLCRVFYKSRATISKPVSEGGHCEETGSGSLPPLVDTYINFDQVRQSTQWHEQVPCFFDLPPNFATHHETTAPVYTPLMEGSLQSRASAEVVGLLDFASYDDKGIRDVLDQFNSLEGVVKREFPQNLACGGDDVLPHHIWNP